MEASMPELTKHPSLKLQRGETGTTLAPWAVPFAFACVYFCWGSTYTAIRIAAPVLPPLVLTAVRFPISGLLMLGYCRLRGMRLIWSARDMGWLALIGLLMLALNNFVLAWSEKSLPSGMAALIVAVVPLYVALLGIFWPGGERLRLQGWLGLLLGFAGLAALLSPGLRTGMHGDRRQLIAGIVLLLGALPWAIGSLLGRQLRLPADPFVAAGWQMLFAGLINASLATVRGDWSRAHWTRPAIGAIAYLVTFGSLVGFTAYVWLLKHVPVPKVATYAYVNPVVAVALGAVLLHERLVLTEYVGMVAVIAAVALVTSSAIRKPAAARSPEALDAVSVEE